MSKVAYTLNGRDVTREEFLAGSRSDYLHGGSYFVPNTYSAHDPLVSDGMGCMKSQVPVKDNGQLEITSRRGRKELLAVRGLVDNSAGYGD